MQWKLFVASVMLCSCRLACAFDTEDSLERSRLMAAVDDIEATVKVPTRSGSLQAYERWYAAGEGSNAGYVIGVYRTGGADKVTLVPYKALPVMSDGGCSMVAVRYSLREHRIESVSCNGVR